jgi:hypothetical protein
MEKRPPWKANIKSNVQYRFHNISLLDLPLRLKRVKCRLNPLSEGVVEHYEGDGENCSQA